MMNLITYPECENTGQLVLEEKADLYSLGQPLIGFPQFVHDQVSESMLIYAIMMRMDILCQGIKTKKCVLCLSFPQQMK